MHVGCFSADGRGNFFFPFSTFTLEIHTNHLKIQGNPFVAFFFITDPHSLDL
jgi:hypothetical protein